MDEKGLKRLYTILQEKIAALKMVEQEGTNAPVIDKKYLDAVDKAHKQYITALDNYNKAKGDLPQ